MYLSDVEALNDIHEPNEMWENLSKKEIRIKRTPRNYFEKMSNWTNEGKIWKFPIDNEQGMLPSIIFPRKFFHHILFFFCNIGRDDEAQCSFADHIFFENQLNWCPKRGVLRNFMDLVCTGLSKNPHLTVREKHEHIAWYKEYFEAKRNILERAITQNKQSSKAEVAR